MNFFPSNAKLFAALTAAMGIVVLSGCGDKSSHQMGHSDNRTDAHESHGISETVTVNGLTISEGWVRAIPASARTTAGYFRIENRGESVDTLIALKSDAAEFVELHETLKDEEGNMLMRRVPALALPVGGTVLLQPGSYHVMMINPTAGLADGDVTKVTLTFEKAGDVDIMLRAKSAAAHAPTGDHKNHQPGH